MGRPRTAGDEPSKLIGDLTMQSGGRVAMQKPPEWHVPIRRTRGSIRGNLTPPISTCLPFAGHIRFFNCAHSRRTTLGDYLSVPISSECLVLGKG